MIGKIWWSHSGRFPPHDTCRITWEYLLSRQPRLQKFPIFSDSSWKVPDCWHKASGNVLLAPPCLAWEKWKCSVLDFTETVNCHCTFSLNARGHPSYFHFYVRTFIWAQQKTRISSSGKPYFLLVQFFKHSDLYAHGIINNCGFLLHECVKKCWSLPLRESVT